MRWLADENFNNDIVRELRRSIPDIDLVRVQDAGLTAVDDETLLAWAAEHDRILLTHDVSTITAHAYRRVMKGPHARKSPAGAALRQAIEVFAADGMQRSL